MIRALFPRDRSRRASFRRAVLAAGCAAVFAAPPGGAARAAEPLIDNERVTVWDATGPLPPAAHDFVAIPFARPGTATFGRAGATPGAAGERTVVIALKDSPPAPVPNTSGFPNAYPRPGIVKLLENDRVIVWSYHWVPGEPTPMHFHNTDVVVVYQEDTPLESITPDGARVLNPYKFADIRFNRGNRTHSELLVGPSGSAVITEVK